MSRAAGQPRVWGRCCRPLGGYLRGTGYTGWYWLRWLVWSTLTSGQLERGASASSLAVVLLWKIPPQLLPGTGAERDSPPHGGAGAACPGQRGSRSGRRKEKSAGLVAQVNFS